MPYRYGEGPGGRYRHFLHGAKIYINGIPLVCFTRVGVYLSLIDMIANLLCIVNIIMFTYYYQ
jgi:hypothetical protein